MAFNYAQKPSAYNFYLMCGGYFCSRLVGIWEGDFIDFSVFTLYWDLIHDWEPVEKEIIL